MTVAADRTRRHARRNTSASSRTDGPDAVPGQGRRGPVSTGAQPQRSGKTARAGARFEIAKRRSAVPGRRSLGMGKRRASRQSSRPAERQLHGSLLSIASQSGRVVLMRPNRFQTPGCRCEVTFELVSQSPDTRRSRRNLASCRGRKRPIAGQIWRSRSVKAGFPAAPRRHACSTRVSPMFCGNRLMADRSAVTRIKPTCRPGCDRGQEISCTNSAAALIEVNNLVQALARLAVPRPAA